MLHRHATGCAWRDLPERYGPWSTVASRQRRWTREGLWARGEKLPLAEPADHALGRSRGGFTTKPYLVTDGSGLPPAVARGTGQAHESRYATRVLDAVRILRRTPGRPRRRPAAPAGDETGQASLTSRGSAA